MSNFIYALCVHVRLSDLSQNSYLRCVFHVCVSSQRQIPQLCCVFHVRYSDQGQNSKAVLCIPVSKFTGVPRSCVCVCVCTCTWSLGVTYFDLDVQPLLAKSHIRHAKASRWLAELPSLLSGPLQVRVMQTTHTRHPTHKHQLKHIDTGTTSTIDNRPSCIKSHIHINTHTGTTNTVSDMKRRNLSMKLGLTGFTFEEEYHLMKGGLEQVGRTSSRDNPEKDFSRIINPIIISLIDCS